VFFLFLLCPATEDFVFSGVLHWFFSHVSSHAILSEKLQHFALLSDQCSSAPGYFPQCGLCPVSMAPNHPNLLIMVDADIVPMFSRRDTFLWPRCAGCASYTTHRISEFFSAAFLTSSRVKSSSLNSTLNIGWLLLFISDLLIYRLYRIAGWVRYPHAGGYLWLCHGNPGRIR
jgi:hypothetical protein